MREGWVRWVLGWGWGWLWRSSASLMVMQFRFARNLVRKKSTSRTFNTLFEGYVDSGNLHTPERECSLQKCCPPITQTSIYHV